MIFSFYMRRMIVIILLSIGGLVIAGVAGLQVRHALNYPSHSIQTQGTIVDYEAGYGDGEGYTPYYPVYRFKTKEGKAVTVTATFLSHNLNEQGKTEIIWYNKRNPNKISLYNQSFALLFGFIFLFVGASTLFCALFMLRRTKKVSENENVDPVNV